MTRLETHRLHRKRSRCRLAAVGLALTASSLLLAVAAPSAAVETSRATLGPSSTSGSIATTQRAALRLRVLNVNDPVARRNAFRMLVPADWRVRGGMVWDLRYHTLASAIMEVRSSGGREALETYPLYPHVWDSQGIFGFPEGSIYLGAIVQRPLNAVDYLERLVVPTFRGRANPRVVQRVRLTGVARAVSARVARMGFPARTQFDAARVRIAYQQGGRAVEEDFYTLVYYWSSPILPTRVNWATYSLYSFRAPRGTLNRHQGVLQAMVASVRVDLGWYAAYRGVQRLWEQGQMQAIRGAGELSRAITRSNEAVTESLRSSYRTRQEAYDRVSTSFSERIRGVETYRNPFEGRDVQLPSTYSNVWASPRGEYVFSNNPGFDPNVGSTIEWRRLSTS